MISIIDCGVGNSTSINNSLEYLGFEVKIIRNASELNQDSDLVLCGVGSFDSAMISLKKEGFLDVLPQILNKGEKRVLGICLGMHILTQGSEEGILPGLGYFPIKVKKLNYSNNCPIPHIGWNTVNIVGYSKQDLFYFAHNYALMDSTECAEGETIYGQKFISMIKKDNVLGVQFHPEKSYEAGGKLLQDFFTKGMNK